MLELAKTYVKLWDWRLFAFILLFMGLPNVYQLYRIYLVGELPDTGSLAIVSQWQFIGLVIEVFQEATVLAIFYFLGSQLRRGADVQLDRAKSVLTLILVGSIVFSFGVFLFRDAFIAAIGAPQEIREQTREFLAISIFSVPFTILAAAIVVLFEALRLRWLVLAMAILNIGIRFALDSLFFGGHRFSLEADVVGVGWSTFWSSVVLFAVGSALLVRTKRISVTSLRTPPTFEGIRDYLRVGLGSGSDSLIRNVVYFAMIIRIVNTIGAAEIGGYYLAMHIMWSFMLVPVLAFADSVKALVANASHDMAQVRKLWHAAMLITAGMMVLWVALVPTFRDFAGVLSNDDETIRWTMTALGILFVPYVLFSFNTVMDSMFYGLGRTKYLAYQSAITNGTVYSIAFILYISGAWVVTFESVMVLFGLGILVDSILTVAYLAKVLYLEAPEQETATQPEQQAPSIA